VNRNETGAKACWPGIFAMGIRASETRPSPWARDWENAMKERVRLWLIGLAAAGSLLRPREGAAQMPPEQRSNTLDAFLAPSPGGLTSDEAASHAETTSYDAGQRRQELAAAEARLYQALVAYYPRLGLTASYTRLSPLTQTFPVGNGPPEVIPSTLDVYSLQAALTVPLSDYILRLSQSYAAASRNRRASVLNEQAARLNAAFDGRNTYYSWVRAKAQVFVSQRALDQTRAHLEDARHAFEVGTASKADVLQVEAQVASSELVVEQAKNASALAEAQLRTIMHERPARPFDIGEDIRVDLPPMQGIDDMAALQGEAFDRRLEVRALDETVWSLREQAKTSRGAYYPKIDAFGDAYYSNPNSRIFIPDGNFHATWDVGVRLSWTPNDAFSGKGAAAETEARAAQTELQKAALRDSIGLEVVQAVQGVKEAEFATQSNKRELASAEESYRVRRELFRNGRATSVELTDAELELTRASLSLVNTEANLRLARARLQHVLGRDTPPPPQQPQ
jgi:outer membrane protein TolC